ncbi:hypothetical protein [Rugosimonospora africana]|uniref:hypothetical protein n=1 Tax=Rugosimonospora africana TaxID=556532 RepID=UPI0019452293|nr:hypothetical protein [Rugosimonospora africana]
MAVDPEQQAAWLQQAAEEPEQQREWIRQNNVIYAGLIAIGLVLVQPFLTVTTLNWSAKTCVIAFSVAIPLLAALVLVNRQESFRRRATDSLLVRATQAIAQFLAFVGVVAGFWHIMWLAGVGILVSGFVAMMVHSAGYFRLERAAKAAIAEAATAQATTAEATAEAATKGAAAPAEPAGQQSTDDAEE